VVNIQDEGGMMAKTELDIIIDEKGEVHVDVKGMKGKGCLTYLKELEKLLGALKTKNLKPDYYEDEVHITSEIKKEEKDV